MRHIHKRQKGYTPFVQAGAETSDTGGEAVTPNQGCSWQGNSRSAVADVGDESRESRIVVQPFRIRSVNPPERRTSVVVR